ncbi:hypothetical protein D3C87_550340 [compost metagenome]
MRCVSLSIGIANYRSDALRSSETRLHFSVADAEAVHRYASLAWPAEKTGSLHLQLCDDAASTAGMEQAFSQIIEAGRFGLAVLYLSGHGQRGIDHSGWFCLWDAVPDSPSLDRATLNDALNRLDCESVLLILDCCHAESIVSGMPFFAELRGRKARLFCASSRTDERAWEDSQLRRSVLSHVLFLGLSRTSTMADPTGHVSVDEQLLPYLRDQVPLLAAKMKRGTIQQPVVGGQAAIGMRVPTVQTGSIGRSLTLREVLRNQLKRLVILVIAAVCVVLLFIDTMWSHLAISGDQTIVVRPGIASTFSLLPVHLGNSVDTGFKSNQLDPTRDDILLKLASGEFRSISTQRTSDGLRMWIEQLAPILKDRKALEFIRPAVPEAPEGIEPVTTFSAINFAARVQGTTPIALVGQQRGHAPLMEVSCATLGNEQLLDFDMALTGSLEDYIRGFVRYGATQGKDPSAEIWKLTRFIAQRSRARGYDSIATLETQVLLEEISRSKDLALSPQTLSDVRAVLPPAQPSTCSLQAIGILIALGHGEDKVGAEALLRATDPTSENAMSKILSAFRRSGAKSGDLIALPRRYFAIIGSYRPLSSYTVKDMENWLDNQADEETERLLEHVAMEPSAYDALHEQLQNSEDPMRQSVAARYLARAFSWQTPTQQETLLHWVEINAAKPFPGADITLAAALLGRERQLDVRLVENWVRQLAAGVHDPQSEFEENHLIVLDGRNAVAALAIAGTATPISAEVMERVETLLANRSSIPLRREAIAALGSRLRSQGDSLVDAARERLVEQRADARRRLLTVDIVVAALNGLSAEGRAKALRDLAALWRVEPEPELRKALGLILARTD